jgi:hypothetical protein
LLGGLFHTARAEPAPRKLALLVGCTRYDHLPEKRQLNGPGNDVKLLARVLQEKLSFDPENIVTLTEHSGRRPTRANILAELERLARIVRRGDRVVVLLAGHGSQQPDQEPFDEEDGLDQVFLPCDAASLGDGKTAIGNAIIDDELNAWSKRLADKGARLWLIADCCHSGTLLRGDEEMVAREVPASEFFSEAVLKKARDDARARQLVARKQELRWVAIYAAQKSEPTYETTGLNGSKKEKHGLLTWTLCRILSQAQGPISYRELTQQIRASYLQSFLEGSRSLPTPLVEGLDWDEDIFGGIAPPARSRFTLKKNEADDSWMITGGALHGVSAGDVLAVYPRTSKKIKGHVEVVKTTAFEAEVKPCAHDDMPRVSDLPEEGRAEWAKRTFGSLRLPVGIEAGAGKPVKDLAEELRKSAGQEGTLFQLGARGERAEWQLHQDKGKLWLVPAGLTRPSAESRQERGAVFGPYEPREGDKLAADLNRIARARNLLRLTTPGREPGSGVKVQLTMLKLKDEDDPVGQKLVWQKDGLTLKHGEVVAWDVTNLGRTAVDVTVLFVDSAYGIEAVFPAKGTTSQNRFAPGKTRRLTTATVNAEKSSGWEHMVVIAVRAEGIPIDFTFLEQPSLPQAVPREAKTPLGLLLQNACFAQGRTRGVRYQVMEDYTIRVLSWRVLPKQGTK